MSSRSPHIAVVVPAYNEASLIAATLASIPGYVRDIIVVDDASEDGTAQQVRAAGDPRVRLVQKPVNQGVGRAIVDGYATAFRAGADVAVVMAGDGQMHPEDLPRLLSALEDGHADYVKGDRLSFATARALMPRSRWLGNVVLGQLTRWATGLPVRDSQCGYTALRHTAARRLPLQSLWPRYGYPNDLLAMLAEHGMRVREVTVRPVYGGEKSGVRLRDALLIVPYILLRAFLRRATQPLLGRLPGRSSAGRETG